MLDKIAGSSGVPKEILVAVWGLESDYGADSGSFNLFAALATDVKLSIHAHPTLSETVMESAEAFFGQATHIYAPKR